MPGRGGIRHRHHPPGERDQHATWSDPNAAIIEDPLMDGIRIKTAAEGGINLWPSCGHTAHRAVHQRRNAVAKLGREWRHLFGIC